MRNNQKVIERLLARKSGRKDKYKIGLIIEGGGMRGAFSGGVMVGLEKAGLADSFDYVYASSSGSCSGAYFLSKQTELGISIYQEDLDGYKFIKPWRLSHSADIDYLCDIIFRKKKTLDTKKIKKSKTIFKIFVADALNGECTYYTNKDNVDMIQVIKASCAMPAFYNKPVTIGKNQHLDGRIGKPLPIEDAIADGCTDILVVATVPEFHRSIRDGVFIRWLKRILMHNLPVGYKRKYSMDRVANYNESLDVAFGKKPVKGVHIYTIAPDELFSKFENNAEVLNRAVDEGLTKAQKALGKL